MTRVTDAVDQLFEVRSFSREAGEVAAFMHEPFPGEQVLSWRQNISDTNYVGAEEMQSMDPDELRDKFLIQGSALRPVETSSGLITMRKLAGTGLLTAVTTEVVLAEGPSLFEVASSKIVLASTVGDPTQQRANLNLPDDEELTFGRLRALFTVLNLFETQLGRRMTFGSAALNRAIAANTPPVRAE